MEVDDIIQAVAAATFTAGVTETCKCDQGRRPHDLVTEEKSALQKGMNFAVGKKYSIFVMSLRENAPCADALDLTTGTLKSC